jgi:hypothetical protein
MKKMFLFSMFFVMIFCIVGCSNFKNPYMGNTYDGNYGAATLQYQFLSEDEFKLEINSWAGGYKYICHYNIYLDEIKVAFPDLYEPLSHYLDGCELLIVDSIQDIQRGLKMMPRFQFIARSGMSDLDNLMILLYNNETDEIITMSQNEINEMLQIIDKSNQTCRSNLFYLSGIKCSRNKDIPTLKVQKEKSTNKADKIDSKSEVAISEEVVEPVKKNVVCIETSDGFIEVAVPEEIEDYPEVDVSYLE